MCLIIHRPVGGPKVDETILDYNSKKNPDGFGVSWRSSEGIKTQKYAPGRENYEAFKTLVLKLSNTGMEFTAHFRLATHGPACEALSHPFEYTDRKAGKVLVFHNGIINIPKVPKGESDTSHFVKTVLTRMPSRWWENSHLRWMVEESIGWSRLLIMTGRKTLMLNKSTWKGVNGIWYSTDPAPSYALYSNGKGGGGNTTPKLIGTGVQHSGNQPPVGGGKIIMPSQFMFGDDEDDGDETSLIEARSNDSYVPMSGWSHLGHSVIPITTEAWGGGLKGGMLQCEVCSAIGEYIIEDEVADFDIEHQF